MRLMNFFPCFLVPPPPSSEPEKEEKQSTEVSTLFVSIVFGVVLLLVAMLIFGVAWKQGMVY